MSREKRIREDEIPQSDSHTQHLQPIIQSQPVSQVRRIGTSSDALNTIPADDDTGIINTSTEAISNRHSASSSTNSAVAVLGNASQSYQAPSYSTQQIGLPSHYNESPKLMLQMQSEQIIQQQKQLQQQALELASQHQQRVVMMNILAGTSEQQKQIQDHQKELHHLVQRQLQEQIKLAERVRKQKFNHNLGSSDINNVNLTCNEGSRSSPAMLTNASATTLSTPISNPMSYSMTPDGNVNVKMNLFAINQGQSHLSDSFNVESIASQSGIGAGIGFHSIQGGLSAYDSHLASHVHALGPRVGVRVSAIYYCRS